LGKLLTFTIRGRPNAYGEYEPNNFKLTDIEAHFELSGQIHTQINDLPDGTKIKIRTIE
jgi:hypothetical protein